MNTAVDTAPPFSPYKERTMNNSADRSSAFLTIKGANICLYKRDEYKSSQSSLNFQGESTSVQMYVFVKFR